MNVLRKQMAIFGIMMTALGVAAGAEAAATVSGLHLAGEVKDGMLAGAVTNITFKGVHYDVIVDFKGFKWLIQTTDFCAVGSYIGIKIDPDGIHVMKKSEYSGLFGDYSSYSAEYDEIGDADYEPEEATTEDELYET